VNSRFTRDIKMQKSKLHNEERVYYNMDLLTVRLEQCHNQMRSNRSGERIFEKRVIEDI